jgi:hypothetical protein
VYNVNADGSSIHWLFDDFSGNMAGEAFVQEVNGAVIDWGPAILSLTLDANTVDLGMLNLFTVGTDSHTISVTTSATNGYTCAVTEDGNLLNGAADINDVADGAVTAGSEEFGLNCSGADCDLTEDTPITGSSLTVASNGAAVTNSTTTMIYKAAVNSTTVNGAYSNIVTYTCAGDF